MEGPVGHYLTLLVMPVHPVALAFFGLFTSCYASKSLEIQSIELNDFYIKLLLMMDV